MSQNVTSLIKWKGRKNSFLWYRASEKNFAYRFMNKNSLFRVKVVTDFDFEQFLTLLTVYLPNVNELSLTKTQRVTIVFNFAMSTHVQCQHKDHEAKNVARYEKPLSVSIFIKYGKFWITSLSHIIKHKLLISEECKYSFTDVLLKLSLWCNNFKTG